MQADRSVGLGDAMEGVGAGTMLGGYRIERLLGRGGMGAVFLAFDTTLRRAAALKILSASNTLASSRALLLREARSAAALNHPNICTVYEVGESGGVAYIGMEYVEGRSLGDRLREGPLAAGEAVYCGLQAARALAYAHARGVVHRDFKAANAILTPDGTLKIVDFGLAWRNDAASVGATTEVTVGSSGRVAGTPYAMAPEQVRSENVDTRTDVWSLGVLLHEMLTGGRPFDAATLPELFTAILRDAPQPLPAAVPPPLAAIVRRCLEKEPSRRYEDAREVEAALEAVHAGAAPVTAGAGAAWPRPKIAAAAVLAAALTGGAYAASQLWQGGGPIRLAVLPFDNTGGDDAQEFFVAGLTDDVITHLGRLHPEHLWVTPRTSSARFRIGETPLETIARELKVDYVLEGSARREGTFLRVNASLVRARDQAPEWSDSFRCQLSEIAALHSQIGRRVSDALGLQLPPTATSAQRAVHPEAYEAYLRGRSHLVKLTRADLDRAQEHFERALSFDRDYAPAYAGIAGVWSGRQQMRFVNPAEAGPPMKAAAARALELDPTHPEVHHRLALRYTWSDWDWQAAEQSFQAALRALPAAGETRAFYAHFLYIVGRPVEGKAMMRQAMELDPLNELVQSLHGVTLMWESAFTDVVAQAERVLATNPNSPMALNQRAAALLWLGRHAEWLEAERAVWKIRGDEEIVAALERGFAEGGGERAIRRAADIALSRPDWNTVPRGGLLYVQAGYVDRAFDWIDAMYARRDPNVPYFGVGPQWQTVRDHPRMKAFRARMKLPPL